MDYLKIHERSYLTRAPQQVAIGATTTRSTALSKTPAQRPTALVLMSDVECRVLQGDSTVNAAATSPRIPRNTAVKIIVDRAANNFVAVIQTTTSGTLEIFVVSEPV